MYGYRKPDEPLHLRKGEGSLAFVCNSETNGAWFIRDEGSFKLLPKSERPCKECLKALGSPS